MDGCEYTCEVLTGYITNFGGQVLSFIVCEHRFNNDNNLSPPPPPILFSSFCLSFSLLSLPHLHALSPCAAIRFSPSKRTRTSIPALKSSSQEILSSQADERNCEERKDRLGGAYSLASLDGPGTQNSNLIQQYHSDCSTS